MIYGTYSPFNYQYFEFAISNYNYVLNGKYYPRNISWVTSVMNHHSAITYLGSLNPGKLYASNSNTNILYLKEHNRTSGSIGTFYMNLIYQ